MKTRTTSRHFRRLVGAALLGLCLPVVAEDIDLFVQPPLPDAGTRPNVLFIIDNTANWNTAFTNEKAAITSTFNSLPLDKFNIGVMFFGAPEVGYVRAAIRKMDAVNRPLYSQMINDLSVGGDRGDARTLARSFSEAYRYLKGRRSTAPNVMLTSPHTTKRDFKNNTAGSAAMDLVHARPGNALPNAFSADYVSPLDPENCYGTYIVYIGNTVPSGNVVKDNAARNAEAGMELAAAGGNTTQLALPYVSHQDNFADEWARFLKKDLGVKVYTVDVDPTPMPGGHGNGMGNSSLLASMASVSGGKYFRVNSQVGGGAQIADALSKIFSEILAVNSVFASVSLPLSVNTQNTYLNQLFVGMFRPDADAMPRWMGNLKQYKLGLLSGQLTTLDADGTDAINSATGFVAECARSYWTTDDAYWAFRPQGTCLAGNDFSNSPDGNVTEKGAQAQRLRSTTARNIKTCTAFNCAGGLVNFNTANVSEAMVGAASAAERDTLVDYQRGLDTGDENLNGTTTTEMRPSAHGDVIHSRPMAINFGTDASPEVVVFYGGNDGVLRAVNGNRSAEIEGTPAGNELWSFVPPEFHTSVKRLQQNTVPIKFEGSVVAGAQPKPYGIDGPVNAHVFGDVADPSVWIFATSRRGGRSLYGFDVSEVTAATPAVTLKWKIGCPNMSMADATGCTPGFSQLAQTWSSPKVLKTNGYKTAGVPKPMLMFGGGYDPCEDADPITDACRDSSKGNRVYVIDADTGGKLLELPTDRGVAADPFIVEDKDTGLALYAYVTDLGGNVYRIHGEQADPADLSKMLVVPFGALPPATWQITRVASLGCDSPDSSGEGDCIPNRKFLFAPDVAQASGSTVYNILVGSGDREKPLLAFDSAASVANHFYMIMDQPIDQDWLKDEDKDADGPCKGPFICLDSLTRIVRDGDDPSAEDLKDKKGWYLELRATEQVVTSAITVFGTVTFSTHEPFDPDADDAPECAGTLGTARVYNVGYANARSRNGTTNRYEEVSGGGLPPSPVAGMVLLDGSETPIPFIIGADPDSPLQSDEPSGPSSTTQPKSLTYWLIER